ncbi:MAG: penicillin-binding protein 2 [Pelolinea sp.]|nr:penicillin-binding protein 2 [Pelolinea sp.]
MKKNYLSRINLIGLSFSLASILIVLQMVRIQNSTKHQELSRWADAEYSYAIENYYPERGNIYDRWGRLLAGNEDVYEVGVMLEYVTNPATIAQTLNGVNQLAYQDILAAASKTYDSENSVYAVLTDFLPSGVIDALSQIKQEYEITNPYGRKENLPSLRGVVWNSHLKRSYPENSLASNILGFYSFMDREYGVGYYGVEEYYNDLLAGKPMETFMPRNPYLLEELPTVPAGASLVLTIDREIQAMVEKKLDEAIKEYEAESGTVIIMDPRNGEILAMASQPNVNLNQYWKYEEQFKGTTPFNRAISETYEPGSVFKVLTMAAAFDAGSVDEETIFNDPGRFEYGGSTIYNWNRRGWGKQTMQGCMQNSLNVCLAWVATELGKDDFYDYMQAFGIGRRTNIDLGGEKIWPLSTPDDSDWYPIQLATNSFGQGVAVTPIQLASAVTAVANDGKLMKPHVLKAIIQNGKQYNTTPQVQSIPLKPETAKTITDMLEKSLKEESSLALVPGYNIAGKTGTAEIPVEGVYGIDLTNASFVGWGPAEDPQFLVYVWIEKPKSSPWGSVVAAPVFSSITQELVKYLDIPPAGSEINLLAKES